MLCTINPVLHAIEAHRAAIVADESSYDADGVPHNKPEALRTGIEEAAAYRAMLTVQCRTPDDVQAKVAYFLTGSVGERTTLIGCMFHAEYSHAGCIVGDDEDNIEALLHSLLIEGEQQA